MKSITLEAQTLIWLAIAAAAAGSLTAQEAIAPPDWQELPRAEEVLKRYVEVTGGREAHERIRSQYSMGTVDISGSGITGTIASFQSAPDKSYSIISLQGRMRIEEGSDGRTAWEISSLQGPRIKTGGERAWALRESTFNPHLHWPELYATAECTAIESIEGRECYQVVLTPAEGKPVHHCYDRESGLLRRVATILASPMGEIPTETLLDDYREVDGIMAAHTLRHSVLTQTILVRIEMIRLNEEIPANRYNLPEAIQELAKKIPAREP